MPASARPRLRALATALLVGGALVTVPGPSASAGTGSTPTSKDLAAQVAQLNRDIDAVSAELAEGGKAYEAAELRLARLTQQQFAARDASEARAAEAADTRSSFDGLARAAYKGELPPMVKAILSGDPRTVSDLAYVQRSVNVIGADRREQARQAYLAAAAAGTALGQSDADRRAALAQRKALDVQLASLVAKADRLTADLAAKARHLAGLRALEEMQKLSAARAAAMREAQRQAAAAAAAAAAAGIPAGAVSTGGGAGCQPPSPYGEANGFLSDAGLCPLDVGGGHRLRTDAARAFNLMNAAHVASRGVPICVTDSYRSFAEQVDVYKRKPNLAATPGRSQHGWGLALDLCGGVQTFGSEAHTWMRLNAPQFGWDHPNWARQGGSKPEAWHWEFGVR